MCEQICEQIFEQICEQKKNYSRKELFICFQIAGYYYVLSFI